MVFDQIGIAKQLPDSSSNPQNIFVTLPLTSNRFNLSGALEGMHAATNDYIAFTKGNSNGRLKFKTTSGYASGKINKDHGECAANGFMQDAKDFRNFEFSCYLTLANSLGNGFFRIQGRGGEHYGHGNLESSAVGIDLGFDGRIRALKIRRFNDVSSYTNWSAGIGDIEGREIGFKAIFYNVQDNEAVKYQLYLDLEGNNRWIKYFETVDNGLGLLGGTGTVGNGRRGQPVTWGGPLVFFSWIGAADPDGVLIKNISLREIDATSVGGSPSIPTTQNLLTTTPEGNLTPRETVNPKSGTTPATSDMYGVLAQYATGAIIYGAFSHITDAP